MRVLMIAAGRGSRLEHYTDERPKCMVEVSGRSILDHQLHALRAHGVDDLHIIRGYLAHKLVVEGATYHANPDWERNNILHSLFCAEAAFEGPLLTSYSDIVYGPQVVKALLGSTHDITLVVDEEWADAYVGREDHPVEQAELCEARGGLITDVGKWVEPGQAIGEFIGLASFSKKGASEFLEVWRDVRQSTRDDEPFGHAELFRKAYLADLFCEAIRRGVRIGYVLIQGGWREIDTVQDLAKINAQGGIQAPEAG